MSEKKKKITLVGLILMIFSSIYGYSNSLTAFYQMGYASIIWYVLTAVLFFLPSALMFAEYGASFKAAKGGIFSWLRGSIGEKPAFVGTFIWLAAWVIGWYRLHNFSWYQLQQQFLVKILQLVGIYLGYQVIKL